MCEGLCARLSHFPVDGDVPDILCGPIFDDLPIDHQEMQNSEAEETFRIF